MSSRSSFTDGPRRIVIGLKKGSWYDAPIPKDEAYVREIVHENIEGVFNYDLHGPFEMEPGKNVWV